jgi:mono/diheme cytochrome c family protein
MRTNVILAAIAILTASAAGSRAAEQANQTQQPANAQEPAKAGESAQASGNGNKLYTVVDGYKVDPKTMEGFRTWRALACDRCHGANQEGLVGPSLINSLKVLSKEDFKKTVLEGRLDKGMPSFNASKMVTENIDNLYAYLKGRSEGAITQARVQPLQ